MSILSATATPFVTVTQLLRKFNLLVEQIKLNSNSLIYIFRQRYNKKQPVCYFRQFPFNKFPFILLCLQKMFEILNVIYDPKLGEIVNAKSVHALPAYRSSRKSSTNLIQYLHDYKKGK